jgi:dTDP-D-glucose 4,6-dehydratase
MMDSMIGTPLPEGVLPILVTGGGGFSDGAMVRRPLTESTAMVFNLDQMGSASDLTSTSHLLQAVRNDWEALPAEYQSGVLQHPISFDVVFGSLKDTDRFQKTTPYAPPSPHAASKAATQSEIGRSYSVVGRGERINKQLAEPICALLDKRRPGCVPESALITPVKDRPGHDRYYANDPARISEELGWQPRHDFKQGLTATVEARATKSS